MGVSGWHGARNGAVMKGKAMTDIERVVLDFPPELGLAPIYAKLRIRMDNSGFDVSFERPENSCCANQILQLLEAMSKATVDKGNSDL